MIGWQLKVDHKIYFSLSKARIGRWIEEGRVHKDHLVWRPGFSRWRKVGKTEEFVHLFEGETVRASTSPEIIKEFDHNF